MPEPLERRGERRRPVTASTAVPERPQGPLAAVDLHYGASPEAVDTDAITEKAKALAK